MPPSSHTNHVKELSARDADSSSPHHDENYKPYPLHSPTPQKGYLLPYAYNPQGSRSSQDILGTLTVEERNADAISVSSQHSSSSSGVLVSLSQQGLVRNLSHPDSRNSHDSNSSTSQPMKVSRTPSPASANTAPPDYSRPSPPLPLRTVLPMSTASVQRWNRNIIVPTDVTYCLVDPLKFKFDDDEPPCGWIRYTHPEGARYFFHEKMKIYTDANLYNPEELVIITESAEQILGDLRCKAREENITLSSDIELVLEIFPSNDDFVCGYYFVEHKCRCLFWLEEFDATGICQDINAVVSVTHLRYEIESQYWTHWELFPNTRDVTADLVDELREITLHATADVLTSRTSTALWNTENNQTILNILNNINLSSGKRRGYCACLVGRLMRSLTHNQFVHLHGQRGARLDRDQSVHASTVKSRTLLVSILSPFLFWAPDAYLQALDKIWVDGLVHEDAWTQFTTKVTAEWQEIIIIVVILLNVNMGFLSISTVDPGDNKVAHRSVAQIASYISAIASLGCLIVSFLLLRQANHYSTAFDAAHFLGNIAYEKGGLGILAIVYALPYAMLRWSILSLLVAFAYMCLFSSSSATRFVIGAVLVAIGALVVLCIWTTHINDSNRSYMQWLLHDLGDSQSVAPTSNIAHDVKADERKADILSRGSAEDKKEPQSSWPRPPTVFVRTSTSDLHDDNKKEKPQV